MGELKDLLFGSTGPRGGKREGLVETAASSAVRSMGSAVGREIVRGVLGGLLGGRSAAERCCAAQSLVLSTLRGGPCRS